MAKTKNAAQHVKLRKESSASQQQHAPQVSTPAMIKLMPPPARPNHAPTPTQHTPASAHSDVGASARKKRRRRARKSGHGGESISESASVVSTNTTSNTEPSNNQLEERDLAKTPNVNGWSHVNGGALDLKQSPTSVTQTSYYEGLTDEQREQYDALVMSSVDGDASESEQDFTSLVQARSDQATLLVKQEIETSTQSSSEPDAPVRSPTAELPNDQSLLAQSLSEKNGSTPQKHSGAEVVETSVPEPMLLPNGRYACPLKETHACEKTYAYVRDARGHAQEHLDPDKFKCSICDKNLRRQDKLNKHMKLHDSSEVAAEVQKQNEKAVIPQSNGVAQTSDSIAANEAKLTSPVQYEPMDLDVEVTDAEPEPLSDDEIENQIQTVSYSSDESLPDTGAAIFGPSRKRKRISTSSQDLSPVPIKPRKRVRKHTAIAEKASSSQIVAPTSKLIESSEINCIDERQVKEPSNSSSVARKAQTSRLVASRGESSQKNMVTADSIPLRSRSIPQLGKHQSSLDGFVERPAIDSSEAVTASAGKRVVINVPPPPIYKNGQKDSKASEPAIVLPKKPVTSRKGKEKAVSSDEAASDLDPEYSDQEMTSSDDRPKATTIARRTSSLGFRKSRPTPRRKEPASDSNDSEDPDDATTRSRRKNRPANREASFKELAKMGEIGRFRDREVEILYGWRDRFCIEHKISHSEFNDMMTATLRKKITWKADISKKDFMQEFYDQLPNRNRRAMLRFRERHFQNLEKDRWTDKDDEELKNLVQQLGQKWVEIGEMMGRSQDFLYQRWTHRLNRGNERNTGAWTEAEEKELFQEVRAVAKAKGKSPTSKNLVIPWAAISNKLGTHRTAQQCSNKWRNETTKRVGEAYVDVPLSDRMPSSGAKAPRTPSKMARRLAGSSKTPTSRTSSTKTFKSAERVEDSDEADDAEGYSNTSNKPAERENDPAGVAPDDEDLKVAKSASTEAEADSESAIENDDFGPDEPSDQDNGDESVGERQSDKVSADQVEVRTPSLSSPPPPRVKISQRADPQRIGTKSPSTLSQRGSQKEVNSTPATSKNPFSRRDVPDLSQAFEQTQATSAGSRSVKSRKQDDHIPDRPSPQVGVRQQLLSSERNTVNTFDNENSRRVETDLDDAKSPNSFVSAKEIEASDTEEDITEESSSEEENDASVGGLRSGTASDSESEASEDDTNMNSDADSDTDVKPTVTPQAQGGGFLSSIRSFVNPFSQRSSQAKSGHAGENKRGVLGAVINGGPGDVQSDDDDDDDDD